MRLKHCCILCLAFCSIATGAGQQGELRLALAVPFPVALDGTPEAGYFILSAEDVVYHYVANSSCLKFVNRFSLQGPGSGIDITFVRDRQEDSVVVTQWADKIGFGYLKQYSTQGKLIGNWPTWSIPSGVDYDPLNQRIYFATRDSHELWAADLHGKDVHSICSIRGAMQLGPIAADTARGVVYVADSEGHLFEVNVQSKQVTRLRIPLGLPAALRFEAKNRILYVADQAQRTIHAVDLVSHTARAAIEALHVDSPTGVAPGPENTLLITSLRTNGAYLARLRAPAAANVRK